jgi:hypothetical protein
MITLQTSKHWNNHGTWELEKMCHFLELFVYFMILRFPFLDIIPITKWWFLCELWPKLWWLLSPSTTLQIAFIKFLTLRVKLPCRYTYIVAWSEWLVRWPSHQLTWLSIVSRNMITSPICSLHYPNFVCSYPIGP